LNPSYLVILLRRTFGFWLGLRLLLLPLMVAVGGSADLTLFTSFLLVLLITGLVLFDAHAAGEDVLVANLGVSRLRVAAPVAALAITLEALAQAVLAVLA
jgi:hypothetical protein